jgi:hypothetical protein
MQRLLNRVLREELDRLATTGRYDLVLLRIAHALERIAAALEAQAK